MTQPSKYYHDVGKCLCFNLREQNRIRNYIQYKLNYVKKCIKGSLKGNMLKC